MSSRDVADGSKNNCDINMDHDLLSEELDDSDDHGVFRTEAKQFVTESWLVSLVEVYSVELMEPMTL